MAAAGRHPCLGENRAAITITVQLHPLAGHAAANAEGVDIMDAPATGYHSQSTTARATGTVASLLFAAPVPLIRNDDGAESPAPATRTPRWITGAADPLPHHHPPPPRARLRHPIRVPPLGAHAQTA